VGIEAAMTGQDIATMLVFCGFGFVTGQALAQSWRPLWQVALYGVLLSLGARLSMLVLFSRHLRGPAEELLELAILAIVIAGCTAVAFHLTRARTMVTQYPWLYERHGLFGWREKAHGGDAGKPG
jgi:branched-chain amino acid transport system ATP-binding protein